MQALGLLFAKAGHLLAQIGAKIGGLTTDEIIDDAVEKELIVRAIERVSAAGTRSQSPELAAAIEALERIAKSPVGFDVQKALAQALFARYGSVIEGQFQPYEHWVEEAGALLDRAAEYANG
jgi:hypothetical protein